MKKRNAKGAWHRRLTVPGFFVLSGAVCFGIIALSLGGRLWYMAGLLCVLLLVWGLISVGLAAHTLQCTCALSDKRIMRGEKCQLQGSVVHRGFLPVGSVEINMYLAGEKASITIEHCTFHKKTFTFSAAAEHVGAYPGGVESIRVQDLFGLMRFTRVPDQTETLLSLPRPFPIDKTEFTVGDEGKAVLGRTSEDPTSPEDTRAYQPGDAMKRVHWKLSMRNREMLVRRYEVPSPPDTLILLDPSRPECLREDADERAVLQDILCETTLAAAVMQMGEDSPVRVPVWGKQPTEYVSDDRASILLLQELLATRSFEEKEDFALQLSGELRRMRRTGAVIIVCSRLNAGIVDAVAAMRKMGPSVRFYLCMPVHDEERYRTYVSQLCHHRVEVCYVSPA